MKAIQFERVGEALDVLTVREIPPPVPAPDEALVEVALSPIHPADILFIRGVYRIQPVFPQAAGLEGMGRIVQSGAGGRIAPGNRVAFRWPGTWAQYVCVPYDRLTPVPATLSDEDAAQFELNILTAMALLEQAAAANNDTIIVTAATSVVAHLIGQFARVAGITTIGIVRGPVSTNAIRTACDYVLSIADPSLAEHVRDLAPRGIAALLDAVGGELTTRLFETLAPQARVIAYGVLAKEAVAVHNATLIYRNLLWSGFGIERWERGLSVERKMNLLKYACEAIARGDVRLPPGRSFPLEDFAEGIRFSDRRAGVGKAFLKPLRV